jgi:hypothetical protein
MLEDLIDAAAEHEEPWDSRNDRGEPVGLGWLEFDLVRVHGRAPPASIDDRHVGPSQNTPSLLLCNPYDRTGQTC